MLERRCGSCGSVSDTPQQHVADAIAKVEPRVDVPLISRYENGVCLATPPQVKAICELYGCTPTDVYDPEDVEFPQTAQKQAKAARGGRVYLIS